QPGADVRQRDPLPGQAGVRPRPDRPQGDPRRHSFGDQDARAARPGRRRRLGDRRDGAGPVPARRAADGRRPGRALRGGALRGRWAQLQGDRPVDGQPASGAVRRGGPRRRRRPSARPARRTRRALARADERGVRGRAGRRREGPGLGARRRRDDGVRHGCVRRGRRGERGGPRAGEGARQVPRRRPADRTDRGRRGAADRSRRPRRRGRRRPLLAEGRLGVRVAKRGETLPPYLFAELDRKLAAKRAEGVDVISLGVGDPDLPTPDHVVEAMREAVLDPSTHRYPSYYGAPEFRRAVASWYDRRFGVELDPETEVMAMIGSKEGIGHIAFAFVDPGDEALIPDPGYPVYGVSTR